VTKGVPAAAGGISAATQRKRLPQPAHDVEEIDDYGCHGEASFVRGGHSCHDRFATIVTGSPREWFVQPPTGKGLSFDGLGRDRATLYEVKVNHFNILPKARNFSRGLRDRRNKEWITQSENQLRIAERCGYNLKWVFNSQIVAKEVQGWLRVPVTYQTWVCRPGVLDPEDQPEQDLDP
jgi:hypothetical protein